MNRNYHDTLYKENGNHMPYETGLGNSDIILKRRYSSVVYCPSHEDPRPGSMYPRAIELQHNGDKNGTILATFECYTNGEAHFEIYESTDTAQTWHLLSTVTDTQLGYGMKFQPHLYELPRDCGDLKEGTILVAGNVIPKDFSSTALHMYKSTDCGKTWEFMSSIVEGGKAEVDADLPARHRPVWEPFLLMSPDNKLYCYYSDERYLKTDHYNQLLAHKVSEDGGYTWGPEKWDVAFPDDTLRPGMPIVEYLPDGKFIMVYEMVNQDRIPVYFRISDNMDDWGELDFMGNPVIARDGSYITGTPYVTRIPYGGKNGTILVTGRGYSQIFANSRDAEGFFDKMEPLIDIDNNLDFNGYSQCILPINGGKQVLNLAPRQAGKTHALIEAVVADVFVRV